MRSPPHRSVIQSLSRIALLLCALLLPFLANAETSDGIIIRSDSGQFIVTGLPQISRLADLPQVATNSDFIRLQPALLAVSAERIKEFLWQELGINGPTRGKIALTLHPARSLDEDVMIVSEKFPNGWNYHVALPDILSRDRFIRALTSIVLLEFANRNANAHSAEIPAWLVDGLSQRLLASDAEMILSSPNRTINGFEESRLVAMERGVDPLAQAWNILHNHSPLTFGQLSWPSDTQLFGADGGIYRASAQLFVGDLLNLKNGAARLRAMLETLPQFYNWQTAFQNAFRENFPRPLDVEKWWALQAVSFIAREKSFDWTPAVSREKLDEILNVDADVRFASNALPARAEISLQTLIRNADFAQQAPVLASKLRDLQLTASHTSGQFAVLTDAYCSALADYLAQRSDSAPRATASNKHPQTSSPKIVVRDVLKKLDALDARRRQVESAVNSNEFRQPTLVQKNF